MSESMIDLVQETLYGFGLMDADCGAHTMDEVAAAVVAALESAGYVIVPREPTEAMVWAICPHLRSGAKCLQCPRWHEREDYGTCQSLCYGLAEDALKAAMISAAKETP